jgi:hypothetical protein
MFARLKRWYTIWLVDDRGAERALVKLRRFRASEVKGWGFGATRYVGPHLGRAEELATVTKFRLWFGRQTLLFIPIGFLAFGCLHWLGIWMPGMNAPVSSPSRWAFEATRFSFLMLLMLTNGQIVVRMQRLDAKHRLRSAYLLSSHCPSCDTSLEGLPPEADGCVVCPTCSAAWKASAVGPQTVAEPEVRAILPGTRGELSWTNPESANPTVGNPA